MLGSAWELSSTIKPLPSPLSLAPSPPTNSSSAFPVDPSQSHTKILGLPIRSWGGLSVRVYKRVEFRFGYRFRSSRGGPIDADQIESGIRFRF